MANIYVRLPHYIASYLRNRIESETIEVGTPIRIEVGDPWFMDFVMHANVNHRNEVNIKCFSEVQWTTMRKGRALVFDRGLVPVVSPKMRNQRLQMHEIYALCGRQDLILRDTDGNLLSDDEYPHEYVPFQMPRIITRDGKELHTRSDWYMSDPAYFIDSITQQFKMIYARFVANDKYRVNAIQAINESPTPLPKGEIVRRKQRARMESIDRFMLRYDIRYGEKERASLKKVLTRDIKRDAYALDADANHADWVTDRMPAEEALSRSCSTSRSVMVLETGVTYPSIGAVIRSMGFEVTCSRRSHLTHAIKTGGKFHGIHVIYADIPEEEQKQRSQPDQYVLAMQREQEQTGQMPASSKSDYFDDDDDTEY